MKLTRKMKYIGQEIKDFWQIFRTNSIWKNIKAWYKARRRELIIANCLETPQGRTVLASAMIEPMRRPGLNSMVATPETFFAGRDNFAGHDNSATLDLIDTIEEEMKKELVDPYHIIGFSR